MTPVEILIGESDGVSIKKVGVIRTKDSEGD